MDVAFDTVREYRAILAAVLAAHVDELPTRVSSGIASAIDELTDPLLSTLPGRPDQLASPVPRLLLLPGTADVRPADSHRGCGRRRCRRVRRALGAGVACRAQGRRGVAAR